MEDVLDVYHLPSEACSPVVCMDETDKQHIGEVPRARPDHDSVTQVRTFLALFVIRCQRLRSITRNRCSLKGHALHLQRVN